jgi:hypothetical protein
VPRLELLEDRVLLDNQLYNAILTSAQRDALLAGLQGVSNWTQTLDNYSKIAQQIPFINQASGQPRRYRR